MNFHTINEILKDDVGDDGDRFDAMLVKNKPITVNKGIDIIGYLIAKNRQDLIPHVLESAENEDTRAALEGALTLYENKNTAETSDNIIDLITGEEGDVTLDDDEEEWTSTSESGSDSDSDSDSD